MIALLDISKLVDVRAVSGGRQRIEYATQGKEYLIEFLKSSGYLYTKVARQNVLYKIWDDEVEFCNVHMLRDFVIETLENENYVNEPQNVTPSELLNWYLNSPGFQKTKLFKGFKSDPDNSVLHKLKLRHNSKYAKKFEVSQLIQRMEDLGFYEVKDKASGTGFSSSGNTLYYLKIWRDWYCVVNRFGKANTHTDGFDCSLVRYKSPNAIGTSKFVETDEKNYILCVKSDQLAPFVEHHKERLGA